jgi:hypothetical protein
MDEWVSHSLIRYPSKFKIEVYIYYRRNTQNLMALGVEDIIFKYLP